MRRDRPVTYPELIVDGPSGRALSALCLGYDPSDINEMVYRVGELSSVLAGPRANDDQVQSDSYLYWALHRWIRSGHRTFTMDGELAWAIAHTELPTTTFDLLPEIPVDGMYVSVPPVFEIGDNANGWYRIEGFFLTTNDIRVRNDGSAPTTPLVSIGPSDAHLYDVRRGVSVVCVSEDKSPDLAARIDRGEAWSRDDWLVYFNMVPGHPLPVGDWIGGSSRVSTFVTTLLYLLQNTTELSVESDPDRPEFVGSDRRARRERERQHRKGRSVHPHDVWHPSTPGRIAHDPEAPVEPQHRRKVSGHVALGYIRMYWVADPVGRKSLETREVTTRTGETRTYHRVAVWVRPYVRGEDPDPVR